MKVRILSGSQAGSVVEMPKTEAENNIATGFAEAAEPAAKPSAKPKAPAKPKAGAASKGKPKA